MSNAGGVVVHALSVLLVKYTLWQTHAKVVEVRCPKDILADNSFHVKTIQTICLDGFK